MKAQHTAATARIQRRLERWELEHLRHHAAELAERLEAAEQRATYAEQRLSWAEDASDSWREDALQMQLEAADAVGGRPGITIGGQLVVMPAVKGALQ